jgi:UPF0716 family protein affecting phage T7 exclusion
MKMLKMCLNWKVLASLAAVGAGVYLFAPGLLAEAVPILLLAVCPLSMLLMMWAMRGGHSEDQEASREADAGLTREEHLTRLRWQQAALAERIDELEQDEPQPARDRKGR